LGLVFIGWTVFYSWPLKEKEEGGGGKD